MAGVELPKTIKAVHQVDPNLSTLVLDETPLPVPSGPDEHLIKVKATSPCLGELKWELKFPDVVPSTRERVPCTECSGIVVTSPAGSPFKPGDEIFFRMVPTRAACLREYAIAMTSELAPKPACLSWEQAAVTPLSALTAYQGLFVHGLLDKAGLPGRNEDAAARERNSKIRVLITGASGGVGGWAVQLAAAAGAGTIVASCGPAKAAQVMAAGATQLNDYTKQSLEEWWAAGEEQRTCDMALDCVGGSSLAGCWSVVREGGVIMSAVDSPPARQPASLADKKLARSDWFLMDPSGSDLAAISEVIDAGKAVPWIDSVFEFSQFSEAFDKVDGGRAKGKVVIKVDC